MGYKDEDSVAFEARMSENGEGIILTSEEAKEIARCATRYPTTSEFIGELRWREFSEFKIGVALQIKHDAESIALFMDVNFRKGGNHE